jgi:UPF0716 protein FxsA
MSGINGPGSSRPVTSATRRPLRRRLLGAGLLALPVLELATIIIVGRAVGLFGTLLLLAAGAVAGVVVLRRVGAAAARRVIQRPGELPVLARPAPPGTALLVPAGLLLIVPGFLSDVVGLVLLVPPVRRAVAARVGEAVVRQVNLRASGMVPGRVIRGEVIPGEVIPDGAPPHPVEVHVTDVRPTDHPQPPRAINPPL